MAKSSVTIRRAGPDDGQIVKSLLTSFGYNHLDTLNFSELTPDWLIAEVDSTPAGCVQVVLSRPLGYIHFMATSKELPHRVRAQAWKALTAQATVTLKAFGAEVGVFFVDFHRTKYKKVLKRRGYKIIGSGNMLGGWLNGR